MRVFLHKRVVVNANMGPDPTVRVAEPFMFCGST